MKQSFKQLGLFILSALLAAIIFIYYCVTMPGGTVSSLSPLTQSQTGLAKQLQHHVEQLADEIGERHYGEPNAYNNAADYIVDNFKEIGLVPYEEELGDKLQFRNIIAEHYGTSLPDEVIVVGAHYDTVWMSPGADDNASGVSVLIEMARRLKTMRFARTIRFVAFANEEHPYYVTDNMGSLFHAKRASERGDKITAMLSLEMLGYFSNDSDSQSYPSPFNWFYPDKANFIAFVSNFNSRKLLKKSIAIFRESRSFPSEGLTAPVALIRDVRRSDHASFWRYGYPAFMVTDTAAYRNRAYHNANDVPNSLDYGAMARITTGLLSVLESLAGRE